MTAGNDQLCVILGKGGKLHLINADRHLHMTKIPQREPTTGFWLHDKFELPLNS